MEKTKNKRKIVNKVLKMTPPREINIAETEFEG
jgi:hypothetical protein